MGPVDRGFAGVVGDCGVGSQGKKQLGRLKIDLGVGLGRTIDISIDRNMKSCLTIIVGPIRIRPQFGQSAQQLKVTIVSSDMK